MAPRAAAPASLLLLLALAACANPRAEQALRAPDTLVGMAKTDLLSCAGVPERTTVADGVEHLTYTRAQTIVEYDVGWERDPWVPGRLRRDVDTWSRSYACEATFTVENGRVRSLTYNPGRDITLCYDILAACLPPAAARSGMTQRWP